MHAKKEGSGFAILPNGNGRNECNGIKRPTNRPRRKESAARTITQRVNEWGWRKTKFPPKPITYLGLRESRTILIYYSQRLHLLVLCFDCSLFMCLPQGWRSVTTKVLAEKVVHLEDNGVRVHAARMLYNIQRPSKTREGRRNEVPRYRTERSPLTCCPLQNRVR